MFYILCTRRNFKPTALSCIQFHMENQNRFQSISKHVCKRSRVNLTVGLKTTSAQHGTEQNRQCFLINCKESVLKWTFNSGFFTSVQRLFYIASTGVKLNYISNYIQKRLIMKEWTRTFSGFCRVYQAGRRMWHQCYRQFPQTAQQSRCPCRGRWRPARCSTQHPPVAPHGYAGCRNPRGRTWSHSGWSASRGGHPCTRQPGKRC